MYDVSHITHHASRITYHVSHITYHASRITHHASRITYHVSRITYHVFIMTLITIRQTGEWGDSPNTAISFDRRGEYPVTVSDPFSPQEEQQLEWYFEEHLKFPFTKQVQAKQAAESITRYGESLFEQVFKSDFDIYERYGKAKQAGVNALSFEIIGSPEFHQLHWEALKDPKQPNPFVVDAPMVRSTVDPPTHDLSVQESPTINLLLVTARPGGRSDVGYRTISRPLVEGLRQANIPVHIEILRPGTYKALVEHLAEIRDRHGVGYYHIIHFDLHGAVLPYSALETSDEGIAPFLYQVQIKNRDCNRGDIETYEGQKAFLFFEGKKEKLFDPAEAEEVTNLLISQHIPITILNACQSGKQAGNSESNLASRLLLSGVQTVLAMGYSVTVSAAALMMQTLYDRLFQKNDLSAAIRHARFALFNNKKRRAYYNQRINLEDWLLPVVYQSGEAKDEVKLPLRPFTFEEQAAFYAQQAEHYQAPRPTYGFVGRDVDILQIEKQLLNESEGKQRKLSLIHGMGGAGKTMLLHHLAAWWQTTGFVDEVFYFGYDEKAYTLHQIMDSIAQQLFGATDQPPPSGSTVPPNLMRFRAMTLQAQQQMLAQKLRSKRHLLILDNLESITGAQLAIQHTLPPQERESLRGFLADLLDGKTLVLLGSRGGDEWLLQGKNAPLRKNDIYDLPGLDEEAASTLAERILERHVSDSKKRDEYRQSQEFRRLLKLLDGYPLPLEIVLANLSRQSPQEILDALQAGDVDLDAKETRSKTESILKCIDYSHSSLSPDAQQLLLCLAPFTGVINMNFLEQYTQQFQQQPALADLPFDRWQEVLQEAANWGLLTPHEVPGFLHLQPIFPYFLRTRLNSPPERGTGVDSPLEGGQGGVFPSSDGSDVDSPLEGGQGGVRTAIETAFRQHYDGIGGMLLGLFNSKQPQERQMGQILTQLEYENLYTALHFALDVQESIHNLYFALSHYLDTTQDHQRGEGLGQFVLTFLDNYPPEVLTGQIGLEFAHVIGDTANRQYFLKEYVAAEASYQRLLELVKTLTEIEETRKTSLNARTSHQLGMVAQEQRQWGQAESYYQQALAIYIEFNDRYFQAFIYGQLGLLAESQEQWTQAQQYLLQALEIFHEAGDEHFTVRTVRNLARLWQASKDTTLPAAVAAVLGISPQEAEEILQGE